MASNDVEVLDPAAPVEKSTPSGVELDRRHFLAALGVAGAAAGTALLSAPKAQAQQPTPNGYAQVDVINLMLNIKYLKATLYSYITQGADLPAASLVTVGTGNIYYAPAKVTFSTQQITDVFNEMYYDELNQLIALRALQGIATVNRPTMNLIGTGPSGSAPSSTTTTLTQSQAIALARLLEDLSASAWTTATTYLTGTNLAYATQVLATDGAHAGAIRLLAIQTGAQYQAAQYEVTALSNTSQTPVTFNALTTSASNSIYAYLGATTLALPAVGNVVTGTGIPEGTVITAVNGSLNSSFVGVVTSGKATITGVSNITGLAVGQIVTGTDIPANTTIIAPLPTTVGGTITMSANASATPAAVTATGYVTSGSNTITGLSATSSFLVGQQITGTGIPASTTITAINSAASSITISNNATANSTVTVTGNITNGSAVINAVSTLTGFLVGAGITGPGIPAGTTIIATSSNPTNTITLSAPATATTATANLAIISTETVTATGITVTAGTTSVTLSQNASVTGVATISVVVPDSQDVAPADIGAGAVNGPAAVPGSSPALYQGFFNTAGSATSSANTPAGFAFARTFQQILAVLYGYNSTSSLIATQNYEGGFFPYGVAGNITSAL